MAYKIDLHTHTVASPDGGLDESKFEKMFASGGLDIVAVTDHDRIHEAQRLQEIFGEDKIIVGEEVTAREGEVIGLYLTRPVKPGMSVVDTILEIKRQKGLVYIPHPFEQQRKGLNGKMMTLLLGDYAHSVDIIEVRNGRARSDSARHRAVSCAASSGKPGAASSDSHGFNGWGRVHSVLPDRPTKETLTTLLAAADLKGNRNGVISYLHPSWNRLLKLTGKLPRYD